MDVYYDNIVYSLQPIGGISVYWYELSRHLLNSEWVNMRFIETKNGQMNVLRNQLDLSKDKIIENNTTNLNIERFRRVRSIPNDNSAIFHSSYFRMPLGKNKIKKVCTVHDFVHDKYFKGPRVWMHNYVKRKAVLESDAIITVSQNTKDDLLQYYPEVSPCKVKVVFNGISERFFQTESLKYGNQDTPYLLFIGARYTYKNFDFAVQIVKQLPGFQLFIVGSSFDKNEQTLLDSNISGRYKRFYNIDTTELNDLYNGAFCLLYPSSYEGFGIPIAEAMQAGCPFIALNASSIPEVAGDAGILLQKLDIDEGLHSIKVIQTNRQSIIERGLKQANLFSWKKCAYETLDVYKSILA